MLVRFLIEIEFLEQGQVELFDTRSKQNVPPRVPEGIVPWRDKVRRSVPSLDCGIGNGPRSNPVGPLTRAARIQKAAYHHWRKRGARRERVYTVEPPSSHGGLQDAMRIGRQTLAAAKGEFIRPAQYETVAKVEIRISPVETQIRRVLYTHSVGVPAGIINAVRVRVGALEIESREMAIEVRHLERIERGIGAGAVQTTVGQVRIGPPARHRAWAGNREVDVRVDQDVHAVLGDIGQRQSGMARELPLNIQIPFVGGRVWKRPLKHIEASARRWE